MAIEQEDLHQVVSTSHYMPHLRHIATINPIVDPDGKGGKVAVTKCGKLIHWFDIVDLTSSFCTDGSRYSFNCRECFGEGEQ
jgi:hypothetical protein